MCQSKNTDLNLKWVPSTLAIKSVFKAFAERVDRSFLATGRDEGLNRNWREAQAMLPETCARGDVIMLRHHRDTLSFGQNLYDKNGFYHRILVQIPECHLDITDDVISSTNKKTFLVTQPGFSPAAGNSPHLPAD